METIEKVKNIINNEKVQNAFYNLYDRWRDESEYEDIKEYGKALIGAINRNCPEYGAELVKTTKRPFGIHFKLDNACFHLYVKLRGQYLVLSCGKV